MIYYIKKSTYLSAWQVTEQNIEHKVFHNEYNNHLKDIPTSYSEIFILHFLK